MNLKSLEALPAREVCLVLKPWAVCTQEQLQCLPMMHLSSGLF